MNQTTPQNAVRITADFVIARVIVTDEDPSKVASNVIVQKLENGEWVRACGFNSLSDDYAYSNAREAAQRIAKRS